MDRRAAVAVVVGSVGAVLGVAGAGHVYLRRWRRAAAWFAGVLGVSLVLVFLFVDPGTVTAESLPTVVLVPLVALLLASVVDAYRVARVSDESGDDDPTCPSCGRSLDPTLDFCWYCSDRADEEPTSR